MEVQPGRARWTVYRTGFRYGIWPLFPGVPRACPGGRAKPAYGCVTLLRFRDLEDLDACLVEKAQHTTSLGNIDTSGVSSHGSFAETLCEAQAEEKHDPGERWITVTRKDFREAYLSLRRYRCHPEGYAAFLRNTSQDVPWLASDIAEQVEKRETYAGCLVGASPSSLPSVLTDESPDGALLRLYA